MHKLLLLPCLLVSQTLIAGESLWTDISPSYQLRSNKLASNISNTSTTRKLLLDYEALAHQLSQSSDSLIELPLPDGTSVMVRAESSTAMSPELAQKFPRIQTWQVSAPNNPNISGSIDIGPNGFHGFIYTATGEQIFIDPDNNNDNSRYTVLSNRNYSDNNAHPLNCEAHDHFSPQILQSTFSSNEVAGRSTGTATSPLITYRLAVATTGEYTELYGGTKEKALAGVNTTISRINQIYHRDLNIQLQIIGNNENIIYTSPNNDPYTNEDAVAMVDENIINIDSVVGSENYDIGHVFGTGGTGGLAFINSVCGMYKAGGVTGSNLPQGDVFNVDYVAHEIGHQLGASHTFNGFQSNCRADNREPDNAVEPGSGSSIMAYAGICGTDNLQLNSDAFFHSVSINEITKYTREGNGSSCGSITPNSNNNPTVDAGNNFIIPAGTAFYMQGETSDSDGDIISHSWEQTDTGDVGGLYTDLGNNPLFRIWPPTYEAIRYFPKLSSLIDNQAILGEILPTTTRSLNFTLLARDNNGGVNQDDVQLSVINTGQNFAVTSQAANQVLSANQSIQVDWDVADTDKSPINCAAVDINLIESSGTKVTLQSNTLNDGSQQVTIPEDIFSIDNAKLQIACHDNIFFALSQGKLTVLGDFPILSADNPTIFEGDSSVESIIFTLLLSANTTENLPIAYTITRQSTGEIAQQGQVTIAQGSNTTNIQAIFAGDTIIESNEILLLTITKPNGAQFINGESTLISKGIILDDDLTITAITTPTIEAQQETSTAETGGGGQFSPFGMLWLLLLATTKITVKKRYS